MTIRVLVVDDSATMRAILKARLAAEDDIEVVGAARDAREARRLIKLLDPDVVTLDVEIPGMNGLSFLEKIMELRPMPVIIVSGATQEGDTTTARALTIGAVSCYAKANRAGAILTDDNGKLAQLVRDAAQVRFGPQWPVSCHIGDQVAYNARNPTKLIAIGSSTGGVEALRIMLPDFGPDCPPTLIVQHVNARFAPAIAQSLDAICPAKVLLAEDGMRLDRGQVYFAPGGDRHLLLGRSQRGGYRTMLHSGDTVSGHRPSVDVLFGSVARLGVQGAVGVLLTGMGRDGAEGLLAMQRSGARTIAQDEASSIVFGMPRAAISLGAAGVVAPIEMIARHTLGRKAA